jgi:hypothetical protein
MCVSRNTGRNYSAPTRTQTTLNAWSQVQARRRQTRQGYQSVRYSDIDSREHSKINIVESTYTYSNDVKCYGSVPAPIDPNVTWWIIGGNVIGLRPYGDMAPLFTVANDCPLFKQKPLHFRKHILSGTHSNLETKYAKALHKIIWRSKDGIQLDAGSVRNDVSQA